MQDRAERKSDKSGGERAAEDDDDGVDVVEHPQVAAHQDERHDDDDAGVERLPGEPIDWLLRMRRFDNEGLLDRLASRGALTDAQVDTLAGRVASFHDALPASPAAYGDPQSVLGWACANFEAHSIGPQRA